MSADRKSFWRDESGSSMIEFTVAMTGFFLILFGIIEFSYVFYQWNAATKAVQYGARLAAVSNPVANDLMAMTGMEGGALPGDVVNVTPYDRVCTSNSATAATGSCSGNNSYDAAAMRRIVFGLTSRTACGTPSSGRDIGMCNIFSGITPQRVLVRYQFTGMGYAGRPGGPVPTITVSTIGLTYSYIFLSGLMGLTTVTMPPLATTVTGEDLKVSATGS